MLAEAGFRYDSSQYDTPRVPDRLGNIPTEPYRLGDTRHIRSDVGRLRALGWRPTGKQHAMVEAYVEWARAQPDLAVQTWHGLGVVIEHVGPCVHHGFHRRVRSLKIGNEHFNFAALDALAKLVRHAEGSEQADEAIEGKLAVTRLFDRGDVGSGGRANAVGDRPNSSLGSYMNRRHGDSLNSFLRENLVNDVPMHIGQPPVDAVVSKRELLVVDAE